jgi:hypothetical protein
MNSYDNCSNQRHILFGIILNQLWKLLNVITRLSQKAITCKVKGSVKIKGES